MPEIVAPGTEKAAADASAHGAVLARGAFFNALAFVSSNLRGIFIFLVAQLLGSAVLGTFGLAWAAMDLLSKFGTLGLDYSAIAFVAKSEAAGDRAGSRRVWRIALSICVGSSIILAGFGSWFVWTIGGRFDDRPELVRATAIMLLAIPGLALYRVSNALSRGMGVMHHDIWSRGLTESLCTAGALLVAILFGLKQLAPEVAAIAGTFASGVVAFLLARRLYRAGPAATVSPPDPGLAAKIVRASTPIALYDLLNLGIMHSDVLMLGWFVGRAPGLTLETLGIYAAAVQVAGGLRKISQAFTPIFTPVVARQISSGRMREAEQSFGYLARWMLAVLLPMVAVFTFGGSSIMAIFGPTFSQGGAWVAILGAACALNAFAGLGETILMVERPQINLFNSAIAFAVAIGLNLVLIPRLGVIGAALAMLGPYALHGLLRGFQISRLLHWRWPWKALLKPWIAACVPLPFGLLLRLAGRGLAWELAATATYLGIYLLAWRIIGLDPSDRALLDRVLKRKKKSTALLV